MGEYEVKQVDGKSRAVHILLAEQLLGRPLKENEVVHHINGDKRDNRPENLQVMDRAEHAALHQAGRKASPEKLRKLHKAQKGKPSAGRKLTEEQVREIAARLCQGGSVTELAKEYAVSMSGIQKINNGQTYRDWLGDYPDDAFPLVKGKIRKPARVDNRKFSVQEVTDIRIRLLQNEAVQAIAKRYGVCRKTIDAIRDNVTYQDIPWPEEIMRLHRTDNMIKLAMLMLSLPLNPEKDEYKALTEDYLIAPDWRSVMMLRLVKRALAGDMEIAMVLMAMAGYGAEIDQTIAEESQIVQVMLHLDDEKKLVRNETETQK